MYTCSPHSSSFIPSDDTLTPENVKSVWGAVRDVTNVGRLVGVPSAVREKIHVQSTHHSSSEKGQAVGTYWLTTLPDISWEQLARHLYYAEEKEALQIVTPYLNKKRGTCLTLSGHTPIPSCIIHNGDHAL